MSRIKEHRWVCTSCGTNLGDNDMWFEGDVCGDCHKQDVNTQQKDEIERVLIDMFDRIGIQTPSNFEDITQHCFEYLIIDEKYNPLEDFDSQVAFAFKRWIEEQV